MARDYARLLCSLWTNDDFRDRSREAQHLYMLVLSQPTMSHAGVVPLTARRWASATRGTTVDTIQAALAELDDSRFLVIDEETEEVMVRSYLRNDLVLTNPNLAVAAVRAYRQIGSARLRRAWLAELRRLDAERTQAGSQAKAWTDQRSAGLLAQVLAEPLPDPVPDPSPPRQEPPTEPLPEGGSTGGGSTAPLPVGGVPTRARASRAAPAPIPAPTPSPKNSCSPASRSSEPDSKPKPKPGSDTDPDWCRFWAAWPRKVDKGHARKAWTAATKHTDPAVIIAAAEQYRNHVAGADPKFIPHPATWLNGERWNDQPEPRTAAGHQPYRNPDDISAYYGAL